MRLIGATRIGRISCPTDSQTCYITTTHLSTNALYAVSKGALNAMVAGTYSWIPCVMRPYVTKCETKGTKRSEP